jgi:hypothetical protein
VPRNEPDDGNDEGDDAEADLVAPNAEDVPERKPVRSPVKVGSRITTPSASIPTKSRPMSVSAANMSRVRQRSVERLLPSC